MATALAIETTYEQLWRELTGVDEFNATETYRVDQRLRRLHELGFEATELELVSTGEGDRLRLVPCVVEHGFHAQRLKALTGLHAEENQARRLLNDMSRFGAVLEQRSGKRLPEAVVAARWLGERFEAAIDAVPEDLAAKLEPAELFHQMLEHRWYLSERAGQDIGFEEAVAAYVRDVLPLAPAEQMVRAGDTGLIPIIE